MSQKEFIAERKLRAVNPDGSVFKVVARLGKPYPISKNEWACSVSLEGLNNNLADQHGIDSWQALQLSSKLVAELLANFVNKGGKLFLHGDEEEISSEELRHFF